MGAQHSRGAAAPEVDTQQQRHEQQHQQHQHQQQQQHQHQQQQQHVNPPPGLAPRVPSIYLRRDYAAACPQQHLAYLHCLQEAGKGWLPVGPWTCAEEHAAFGACMAAARARADPLGQTCTTPAYVTLWADFKAHPLVLELQQRLRDRLRECAAAVGWGSSGGGSGSSGGGGQAGS